MLPLQVLDATLDERIRRAIGIFVPGVCRTDSNGGKHLLDLVDLVQQLCARESATIHGFGTDGDRLHDIFIARHSRL